MSRAPARFTEADLRRAMRVAKREGAPAVEIKPDGTIWISFSPPSTGREDFTEAEKREIVL